jgi:hypothetical protein
MKKSVERKGERKVWRGKGKEEGGDGGVKKRVEIKG